MEDYRRNKDAALDAEFAAADGYGSIRVGTKHIFHRKLVSWECLELSSVVRAWRRVEEVRGKTGCCSSDFSQHYLKLLGEDSSEITLKIGEALYRHEPENLLLAIQKARPEIIIGKPE